MYNQHRKKYLFLTFLVKIVFKVFHFSKFVFLYFLTCIFYFKYYFLYFLYFGYYFKCCIVKNIRKKQIRIYLKSNYCFFNLQKQLT